MRVSGALRPMQALEFWVNGSRLSRRACGSAMMTPVVVHGWRFHATFARLRPRSCVGVGDYANGRRWLELSFVPSPPCGHCRRAVVCAARQNRYMIHGFRAIRLDSLRSYVVEAPLLRRLLLSSTKQFFRETNDACSRSLLGGTHVCLMAYPAEGDLEIIL